MIRIKRAYATPADSDGRRILVDRLWPRGLSKKDAKIDLWLKDVAPSTELRKWFNHDPNKWPEFQKRYAEELRSNPELTKQLRSEAKAGTITLIHSAKDEQHNDAIVLRDFI